MRWRLALYVACLAALGIWLQRFWLMYQASGLFRVIGLDWSLYASQALVLRAEPTQIYSLEAISNALQRTFLAYTSNPAEPLAVGPIPYPPIFAVLLSPFTLPPPPIGLALLTALNLGG